MINPQELELLARALGTLGNGYDDLPAFTPEFDVTRASAVLSQVAERMHDNFPYYHPLYAGQMLKPPHPVARIAYALALWVNPNNHALDGGRASSAMEKECVAEIGRMVGWDSVLGHLTGGGTMANLEALWVAGRLHPGKCVLASTQAHYTHRRISDVLGIPFDDVPVDGRGRLDLASLENRLAEGDVGTVVATIGTTGLGAVDPLDDILALRDRYGFRVHADAAYGGYFALVDTLDPETRRHYGRLIDVDSIVIDPHKHGLQPYGCGCVLFRDAAIGKLYKHDSPATYFSAGGLHLGEISLECSRPGAAAVALWATHRLLPPEPGGEFAKGLEASLRAARRFHRLLLAGESFVPLLEPELDIVVYAVAAPDTREASTRAREIFDRAAELDLHLALVELPTSLLGPAASRIEPISDTVTCLRSVLMKPEHETWIERITQLLEAAARS